MSGADRYQETGQHLAAYDRSGDPLDMQAAQVQATLALAAAIVLPLIVQHMGDTAAITDWARMVAPDTLKRALGRDAARDYEPVSDRSGETVWLDHYGDVEWLPAGHEVPEGWRRLYVEPATGGGAA